MIPCLPHRRGRAPRPHGHARWRAQPSLVPWPGPCSFSRAAVSAARAAALATGQARRRAPQRCRRGVPSRPGGGGELHRRGLPRPAQGGDATGFRCGGSEGGFDQGGRRRGHPRCTEVRGGVPGARSRPAATGAAPLWIGRRAPNCIGLALRRWSASAAPDGSRMSLYTFPSGVWLNAGAGVSSTPMRWARGRDRRSVCASKPS